MAESQGPSAPRASEAPASVRPLPPRASLEHLKNQAKKRLDELRRGDPKAQLSDAQYAIAKEYGFTSWRALKAHVEALPQVVEGVLAAVRDGDLVHLASLLDRHPGLANAAVDRTRELKLLPTDTRAMRLLHVAVAENRLEVARLLLDGGADPDVRNAAGRTPLHDCLELGRFDIERLLRERSATIDICTAAACGELDRIRNWLEQDPALANDLTTNLPPIGWASFGGQIDAVRLLVEHGAEPVASVTLWPAAMTGRTDFARALIDLGADPNEPCDNKKRTALHACAMMNYTDDATGVAEVLLNAGANPDAQDIDGLTPLHLAVEANDKSLKPAHRRLVDLLLNSGATPDLVGEVGNIGKCTPLHLACFSGADRLPVIEALLRAGANPNVVSSEGSTPLTTALAHAEDAIAQALLLAGATPSFFDAVALNRLDDVEQMLRDDPRLISSTGPYQGYTAFAAARTPEMRALLRDRGARPGIVEAAFLGLLDEVRAMLDADPSQVNARDKQNRTTLHATISGDNDAAHGLIPPGDHRAVVELLLDRGADLTAEWVKDWTPLFLAQRRGRDELAELLTRRAEKHRATAAIDAKDPHRAIVEEQAVAATEHGQREELAQLLDAHPHLLTAEVAGPWGQPLLHWAAWHGQLSIVDELLKRGVDANLRDKGDNAYALHFAAEKGHIDIVKRLVEAGGDVHGEGDDHELGVLGWATCLSGYHEDMANYLIERGARLHIFSAIAMNNGDAARRIIETDPTQLQRRMSRNEHRRRPLHHAVAKDRPEMVRLLLDLGADVHAADDSGATALTYATEKADPAMLAMLQNAGAKLDVISALRMKRYDVAETLLREDPTRIGPAGRDTIALHLCAHRGDAEGVRWLIAHGVDVNAKRVLWDCIHTALHVCAEHDRPEIAALLLDAGADPGIEDDKYYSTPLGWAKHLKRVEMIKLLERRTEK